MLEVKIYAASELFEVQQSVPWAGNLASADLLIRSIQIGKEHRSGPGIYACFFDGALIYIGKFLGVEGRPFGGNVQRARWDKHIGTFTMGGRNVSIRPGVRDRAIRELSGPLVDQIRQADPDILALDRGMVAGFGRIRFAAHHWAAFSQRPIPALGRFLFMYVRVLPSTELLAADPTTIRTAISAAEGELIKALRPVCNGGSDREVPLPQVGPNHVEGRIIAVLEQALKGVLTVPGAPVASQDIANREGARMSTASQSPLATDAEDAPSYEEIFLNKLSDEARDFVEEFRARVGDRFQVYFTGTDNGDMRVRSDLPKGRQRVLMTVKWRPRPEQPALLCDALALPSECSGCGLADVEASTDQVMKSRFPIAPVLDQVDALICVLHASERRAQQLA